MASQEADPTELPAACAGEAPGSLGEAAAEDSSAYRPIGRSQNHPEVLRALGVSQPPLTHFCRMEGDNHSWETLFMALWGFLSYSSLDQ